MGCRIKSYWAGWNQKWVVGIIEDFFKSVLFAVFDPLAVYRIFTSCGDWDLAFLEMKTQCPQYSFLSSYHQSESAFTESLSQFSPSRKLGIWDYGRFNSRATNLFNYVGGCTAPSYVLCYLPIRPIVWSSQTE